MGNKAISTKSEARYKFDQAAIINGARVVIGDISPEGLFLTSGRQLRMGEKVDIYWSCAGQEVRVSGIVVRTDEKQGYGVRLAHTAESKKQIMALVARLHLQGAVMQERSTFKGINVASWISDFFQEKQASLT